MEPEFRPHINDDLAAVLEELRPFVDKVKRTRKWYEKRAKPPRIAFRAIGVVIILLSLSIPLIAALRFTGKDLVLSLFAVLIAIATSLNSFFKWEQTWQAFRKSEFALDHLLTVWDLRRVEAMHETDPTEARDRILTAAEQLIEEANKITSSETQQFFDRIELPKGNK
jgi:uncharacterized membrane protein YidH (DUF202 family)